MPAQHSARIISFRGALLTDKMGQEQHAATAQGIPARKKEDGERFSIVVKKKPKELDARCTSGETMLPKRYTEVGSVQNTTTNPPFIMILTVIDRFLMMNENPNHIHVFLTHIYMLSLPSKHSYGWRYCSIT